MKYHSVADTAKLWNISERTVRNYCATGKIPGAVLTGKTWNIPQDAKRPVRTNKKLKAPRTLLDVLQNEMTGQVKGGIYHKIQIDLTYNSKHIEGSRLTHDQTRYIYETNTIGMENGIVNVDDVVETANHFKCIDLVIREAKKPISEAFIKKLHLTLKSGTSDSRKDWFAVGEYKKLLSAYNQNPAKSLEDLLEFHYAFESIHPFQDGNGRVGRLLLFKECLRNNIVPFIITDDLKLFYYRGLHEWKSERGYLLDTCLTAQDQFKAVMNYFRIPYSR